MTYVIWCRVCTPDPTPQQARFFSNPELRGAWAAGHLTGTGHDAFTYYDLPDPGDTDEET